MKITKKIVDDAKPAQRDVWLWDSQLPGFGLRVKPSGVKSYLVQYRDDSRRTRRVVIGRAGVLTTEEARGKARQLLAAVARGENPAQDKIDAQADAAAEPTIEDLCARYLKEWARPHKKPKSIHEDEAMLEGIVKPHFKGRTVASLARKDIVDLHFKLKATPFRANRTVALLSKMLSLSEMWEWRPPGSNPCRTIPKYKEEARRRYPTERELEWIGKALKASEVSRGGSDSKHQQKPRPPEYWANLLALRMLLLTGARTGEILSLRWEHVHLQESVLRLPDSKTGWKQIVLGPAAVKLLSEARRKEGSPWVCPAEDVGHVGFLDAPWRRLKRKVDELQDAAEADGTLKRKDRVDLSGLRIHDLRHGFAAVAAGGGLSLPVIGALLGHTRAETTARYAHLAADPLKQAAGIVSGHIAAVLEGKPEADIKNLREEAAQ